MIFKSLHCQGVNCCVLESFHAVAAGLRWSTKKLKAVAVCMCVARMWSRVEACGRSAFSQDASEFEADERIITQCTELCGPSQVRSPYLLLMQDLYDGLSYLIYA